MNLIKSILPKLVRIFVSTRMMAVLLIVLAVSMGVATFIENDFGTPAAQAMIFRAFWFEAVLVLLAINFIANTFRYNLWRVEKLSLLIFHLAFVLVIIGAAVTRYISFEGVMHIREGETVDYIISNDTYINMRVDNNEIQRTYLSKHFFSEIGDNEFKVSSDFLEHNITTSYVNYIPHAVEKVVEVENGKPIIHIVSSGEGQRENHYLVEGIPTTIQNRVFTLNQPIEGATNLTYQDSQLYIQTTEAGQRIEMATQTPHIVEANTVQPLFMRNLYLVAGMNFVIPQMYTSAKLEYEKDPNKESTRKNMLTVQIDVESADGKVGSETIDLFGGKGFITRPKELNINNLNIFLSFGSIEIKTPFAITLRDFQLDRYPGSQSPSSFASEVTVIDDSGSTDQRIFMNNVIDHSGYRLFQSSYDNDELGTILSVNYDRLGTWITYIAYILMFTSMTITLFNKHSRFMFVNNQLKKIQKVKSKPEKSKTPTQFSKTALILLFLLSFPLMAISQPTDKHDHTGHNHKHEEHSDQEFVFSKPTNIDSLIDALPFVTKKHDSAFGRLMVQDIGGRIKPIHTLASEVLRKVHHSDTYRGKTETQVLLSMMQNPSAWQFVPIIYVDRKSGLREALGGKYISFRDLFSEKAEYLIAQDVDIAYKKKPSERKDYDTEIMALDERVNVLFSILDLSMIRIFPLPNDEEQRWVAPNDETIMSINSYQDSLFIASITPWYLSEVAYAQGTDDWTEANKKLDYIFKYQNRTAADLMPSEAKVSLEIFYNTYKPFSRMVRWYGLVGFIFLIFLFAQVFKKSTFINLSVQILFWLTIALFALHTAALIARWVISGHAPWSDGYESMIYIGWATVLAGILFSKRSKIALAATALMASLILWVADLNWLDPEITQLVPVLKSYWLMVHVAVIVASYGFFALGALVSFMNMITMTLVSNTKHRIQLTIKELTYISEMTLTVGLVMLTIGTFLGGMWANESWGRYWGWDPKETWALVSIIVYAFILHMRFVPGLKGLFAFNLAAVIGFSSIIMTYFGVNYYLSGLHSYAKGDPIPIPTFVYYTLAIITVVGVIAYVRQRRQANIVSV